MSRPCGACAPGRRGCLLHRLADLVEEHAQELGMADTRDMGKPVSQSVGNDVGRSAHNLRFFADHAQLAVADTLPMDSGHHAYTAYGRPGWWPPSRRGTSR
ncbi:aldehyde dehydrogenase family protein [Actinomadura madurae]|nr:aldehyde dehydrogenase family protein [Actinomadura madurae]MCP9951003.1 aldehyde dehydrogenase family protein [Actinomadura madurae]MCP9980239.1 aldehyde dehydrogenase family protein [Actinomadura madurae]MCQ0016449.1 aldehyde dehydrogenase family protein [Actinomadura madurae]